MDAMPTPEEQLELRRKYNREYQHQWYKTHYVRKQVRPKALSQEEVAAKRQQHNELTRARYHLLYKQRYSQPVACGCGMQMKRYSLSSHNRSCRKHAELMLSKEMLGREILPAP